MQNRLWILRLLDRTYRPQVGEDIQLELPAPASRKSPASGEKVVQRRRQGITVSAAAAVLRFDHGSSVLVISMSSSGNFRS